MKLRYAGIPLLAIAAVLPLLARAGHLDVSDPNDVNGRLDVRLATVEEQARWKFTVSTWNQWTEQQTLDKGYILVYLDTFGNQRFDYYGLVRSDGDVLKGLLWRDFAGKPDERIGFPKVTRPNATSARIFIDPGKLRFDVDRIFYSWYVQTLYTSQSCRKVCFDLAPDEGSVLEPRPSVTPSSSPSPSPSASP
jgi:hypothetical protein